MKRFIIIILLVISSNALANIETLKTTIINSDTKGNKNDIIAIIDYIFSNKGIDPLLVLSVVDVESNFNKYAKSKSGAVGLMQVVPRWHKKKIHGRSMYRIKVALEVGTKVLKECSIKYHGNINKVLNCYSGYRGKGASKYRHDVLVEYRRYKRITLKG
jgi:soluble lytic murein transglycosylase-like protein